MPSAGRAFILPPEAAWQAPCANANTRTLVLYIASNMSAGGQRDRDWIPPDARGITSDGAPWEGGRAAQVLPCGTGPGYDTLRASHWGAATRWTG